MTQNATVISVNNEIAYVRVLRASACEGCSNKKLCGGDEGCSKGKPIEVAVKNTIGARVGDNVVLYSGSGFVLGAAFCIFVLPILLSIAAYFAFSRLIDTENILYLLVFLVFVVSLLCFCFGYNHYLKNNKKIEIIKIL